MSKNRHRNVDFKIDEGDSSIPKPLLSWQKALYVLLLFIIVASFGIITIYHKKSGELNKQVTSLEETVNQLNSQIAGLENTYNQLLENHKVIKKTGEFEYESVRGTRKAKNGTTLIALDIDILSERYRWECGDYEKIVRGNKKYDPAEIIKSFIDTGQLNNAKGLICIGMASAEGMRGNEEVRAEKRMETLLDAARKAHVDDFCPIYGLNLGQFTGRGETACSDSSQWQRRVILIKITERSSSVTDEELKDGISTILGEKAKNSNITFPIDITEYSRYGNLALRYGSGRTADRYHNK